MNEMGTAEARESIAKTVWRRLTAPGSPWPWIAVLFLAIAPHLGALANSFAFDDWRGLESPYLVHPRAIWMYLSGNIWQFQGTRVGISPYYRPLLSIINYAFFRLVGPNPLAYHAFSLVLHTLVSFLVLSVVRRLSGSHATGVLAALLFAVHPVSAEPVAWAAGNQELLCALFALLMILSYLHSVEVHGIRRSLMLLSLGACTLFTATIKEVGVMIPVFLVSYEWLSQRRGIGRQLRERWREYSVMAVSGVLYFAARFVVLGGFQVVRAKTDVALAAQVWTMIAVFYRYLAVLFWPIRLTFFPSYLVNRHPWEPVVLAGFVSLISVPVLLLWLYRRQRPEVLAIPLYLLPLLPMLQLPYLVNGIMLTERSAYQPAIGFCWLAAAGLLALRKVMSREALAILVVFVLSAYSVRSALRMYDWKDECQLCQEGIALNPEAPYLRCVTGEQLLRHDRPMEAIVNLREGLRLRPTYTEIHNLLGQAYWRLRQPDGALREYELAAQLAMVDNRPESASRAWSNVGIVYRSLGRLDEAAVAYRRAIELDDEFPAARNNLGFVLLLQGRVPEAISELEAAVKQNPGMSQAYLNLGLAYAQSGRLEEARTVLARAERMMPASGELQARMGQVELLAGRRDEAQRRFERALVLEPDNGRARAGLAALK